MPMNNLSIFNFENVNKAMFVRKLIIFGLGCMIQIWFLNTCLEWLGVSEPSNPYASDIKQVDQLLAQSDKWEVLTLGNSHSRAIDMETLDINGYHLWNNMADYFENHHKILKLFPKLPNVHTVLIAVSYFPWYQDNHHHTTFNDNRLRAHASIPGWYFGYEDFDNILKVRFEKLFPVSTMMNGDWKKSIKTLLLDESDSDTVINRSIMPDGQPVSDRYLNCQYYEMDRLVEKVTPMGVRFHHRIQNESIANRADVHIAAYSTLVKSIEHLQDRNIRVIFYTPPYFHLYKELYDSDTIEYVNDAMEQLQDEYSIEYYDFSADQEFIYDNTLFADDDHLNLCGAQKFSAKFQTILFEESNE